jgi:hypothetical protein
MTGLRKRKVRWLTQWFDTNFAVSLEYVATTWYSFQKRKGNHGGGPQVPVLRDENGKHFAQQTKFCEFDQMHSFVASHEHADHDRLLHAH